MFNSMQGRTHLRVGLASGVAVDFFSTNLDVFSLTMNVAVAAVAALVPDLDEDGSYINKLLFSFLKKQYRSLALLCLGVLLMIAYGFLPWPLWVLLLGIYFAGVAYIPHRSLTHSLLGMAYVMGIVYLAIPDYFLAFAAGYLSHLIADAITVAGIPLFWPYPKKLGLKQLGLKVRTGQTTDIYLGRITLIFACLGYVYLLGRAFIS